MSKEQWRSAARAVSGRERKQLLFSGGAHPSTQSSWTELPPPHHHLQQLLFSVRRCPCSRNPLNIGKPSHSISSSTERELLGSPLFPWIFRWDEEAIRLQYWRDLLAVEEQRREETRAGGSRNCFSHYSNFCVLQSESGGNLVSTFTFCRSLIKVKFPTDQFRPALGSCCRLIDCC